MAPFYESVCAETGWTVDPDLLAQLKSANEKKLVSLEEAIEDSEKNFGETEQKEALQAKAEYLCRAGHKANYFSLSFGTYNLEGVIYAYRWHIYFSANFLFVGIFISLTFSVLVGTCTCILYLPLSCSLHHRPVLGKGSS